MNTYSKNNRREDLSLSLSLSLPVGRRVSLIALSCAVVVALVATFSLVGVNFAKANATSSVIPNPDLESSADATSGWILNQVQDDNGGVPGDNGGVQNLTDDQAVQPQSTPITKIPIYRAAKYQGGYFYTADLAEYKTAVNFGMRLESGDNGESPAFYATDASTPGALPVRRSAKLTGDGYFYTVSEAEHATTPANNMRQETYTFYAMPAGSQMYDEIPMYRGAHLPNHGNGNEGYIYTADRYEYDTALPANGYRQESEVFRVFGDGGAVTPPTPPIPAGDPCDTAQIAGNISTDNINFYNFVCNYAGGDLIIKATGGVTYSASSTITLTKDAGVTTIPCTTTGQGYTANNEIGCVIPKTGLTDGTIYEIFVTNGSSPNKVGELLYSALPQTFTDKSCTTMQGFASGNCKGDLHQGQSILLQDTRGGADIGYGAGNYRVKKMPDGNVWQIDNLALDPSKGYADDALGEPLWESGIQKVTCDDYDSPSYCDNSLATVPQWTDGAYVTGGTAATADHSYGYLYNWCAAVADTSANCATSVAAGDTGSATQFDGTSGLAPTGWKLPIGDDVTTDKSFYKLALAMQTAAATNPVYALGDPSLGNNKGQENWRNDSGTLSPFGGVYSGYYNSGLSGQGAGGYGFYWSSTASSGSYAWYLYFLPGLVEPGTGDYPKEIGFALRVVF